MANVHHLVALSRQFTDRPTGGLACNDIRTSIVHHHRLDRLQFSALSVHLHGLPKFPVLLGLCAVHRAALSSAASPSVCRPINVLNVQTITINVNKRVYYEENDKLLQKLTINVDIFQTVFKLCIEYCCSSCKFEIPVRSCSASDPFSRCLALY